MTTNRIIRNIFILFILIANIGCDQISKRIVREEMGEYETISLVKNHLTLTKVENTGAFLSVGSTLPDSVKFFLLSIIPLLALSFGIVYLLRRKNLTWVSSLALSFAIGGGIGNIYDRVIYGSVTDFLHINIGPLQTGIFNMADVSIMVGLLLFFVQSLINQNSTIHRLH